MYGILTPIHSLLRWAVLLLLLAVIFKSLHGLVTKRSFSNSDNKISLFMMISAHTQLLVGIIYYFVAPSVQLETTGEEHRFFTMEHSVMMIIAIVFMTLARILSKKGKTDAIKFRRLFIFSLIALIIIIMMIPWPFPFISHVTRPWF
ncbi:MAG TPA: cytochrome B [Bacteroidia bacterium]|jgi:hypothetical protein|nr:cytochrome B [Bacteroidia bacterium]